MTEDDPAMQNDQRINRNTPKSDLDMNMMLTDSQWGKHDVPEGVKESLTNYYKVNGPNQEEQLIKDVMWERLGMFTRDIRLANLSSIDNELNTVRHRLNLAASCINNGYKHAFMAATSQAATILETSQSKGGFYRKLMNTFIKDERHTIDEPKKRDFFGGKKEAI